MSFTIKSISPDQYSTTVQIEKKAFAKADHSDGTEHLLITKLRNEKLYIPDFDIIAVSDKTQVIGHAMLSTAKIKNSSATISQKIGVLAPLAVLPNFQKQGVGTLLLHELEQRATKFGLLAISILGDPAYYGRFGYAPASTFDINAPFDVDNKFFMMKELQPHNLDNISGTLEYQASFGI
ncbi:GNAT family N-acetyltransferase [Pediococcus claussenii]|uniref:Acetyltransferase family protein n=1 Tax=Pediococcus claussenii (strain ATCC BAA-344 / DSM 14800 / JCM 18046 / KCTC 3811 / LMG 21948 / P06) TaxID=701521 RepID=G8PAQ4_PEDCP|nr:N-acetyltransferase [Pediococcus claussenii]AEV94613.1 acetyltransferase family protein [Pediococcus claussenii ATCC BAA-344]ANZ69818.1 hypothetical protein AYR57_05625 [Pediococcus claussenii]KRN20793.1 hypothetical protein IV79_GL000013 [Pediococcus claussenii]